MLWEDFVGLFGGTESFLYFVSVCLKFLFYILQLLSVQLIKMNGKVCIVTGANSGVGLSAATLMADKGYDVILACRREEAGEKAVGSIKSKNANARVTFMKLDLASKNSIEEFTNTFLSSRRKLHVLINNAGDALLCFVLISGF